jgi:hypothetical protein
MKHLDKEIFECPKCNIKLQKYFEKPECLWTVLHIWKRCATCLEVFHIKIPTTFEDLYKI